MGFDISCGVRLLHTGLRAVDIEDAKSALADALYTSIPAGVGSEGAISLDRASMRDMLEGGARWAVERGFGSAEDLRRKTWHLTRRGRRFMSDWRQALGKVPAGT